MRFDKTALLVTLIAVSATFSARAYAQETFGLDPGQTPRYEVSVGYTYLHANAPPGQCGCFSANGGFGSVVSNVPRGLSIVADFSAVHAGSISGSTQSITVSSYLFGPRYSLRSISRRFVPYGQALGGGSHESSNYAYVQSVNGAAFSLGGGVSMDVDRNFSWTIVEADWVESRLPNAKNNLQNDLRVGTAITLRFGSH
jgi:hypothetical protein